MSANYSDPAVFDQLPHDNRGAVFVYANYPVIVLTTFVVGVRVYTRTIVRPTFGVDDYLALVATAFAWSHVIANTVCIRSGLGSHVWDILATAGPGGLVNFFRDFYVIILTYSAAILAIKMTFLAQFYRVFAVDTARKMCIFLIVVVGGWVLSQLFLALFICFPIAKFWDRSLEGKCIDQAVVIYWNAGGNIVTDLLVFIFPLPILYKLNMPRARKLFVFGVFCLGFFTVIISFVRLKFLTVAGDVSYTTIEASSWSNAEVCSGIICASLAPLGPLVEKYFPGLLASTRGARPDSHPVDFETGEKSKSFGSMTQTTLAASTDELTGRPSHSRHNTASGGVTRPAKSYEPTFEI